MKARGDAISPLVLSRVEYTSIRKSIRDIFNKKKRVVRESNCDICVSKIERWMNGILLSCRDRLTGFTKRNINSGLAADRVRRNFLLVFNVRTGTSLL